MIMLRAIQGSNLCAVINILQFGQILTLIIDFSFDSIADHLTFGF